MIGIPGNLLIMASVVRNRHLGSSYNILVCNLAMADLLLIVYSILFDIVDLLYGRFPGTYGLCQFNAFMLISLKAVSISALMVIAINRWCQICYFTKCDRIFSKRNTFIICGLQWTYGWVLAGLPLFSWSTLKYDKMIHECSYDRFASTSYTIVLVGTVIAIPVSVSLVCYVKILLAISRRNAKVRAQLQSVIVQRHVREIRSVKTQLAVFIVFICVTTPYGLTAMFADDSHHMVMLHSTVNILGHANSVINCFIYGIMNKRIRKEYKDIILCKKHDHRSATMTVNSQRSNANVNAVTKESML
ncbi:melatonin receptor type 1A-like [Gigantopelta aegis]|uniref:melatonin receptor type 1A-like n=1 Tax=Gigantopelta aegis TaxID=1735272 RepID=UPI001B88C2B9|nr:melatonin receptor type 1A-like [Gigantopelta aegis]